ncbi:LysE/ArgO family amino acid transporter [uncultured Corynebacterium sp.]|uniref:LysE/ArgO family amino acid transporter n=1 Tax=uncultured Corynebacterium sp. TaxID=159447 RepID=UPI0025D7A7D0|nr:LysE/ArgO family amino acid transporter [uncultured Corynebacterium sp.]
MNTIISGFLVSISLIAAIGAQNAMVLRHGIARSHVAAVALFCIASDAILMSLGTAGFGAALQAHPRVLTAVTLLGIAFLVTYGAMSLRSAWRSRPRARASVAPNSGGAGGAGAAGAAEGGTSADVPDDASTDDALLPAGNVARTLTGALAGIAAVTWLNPHAYLDTVVLVGSVAASYGEQRWLFTAGAIIASAAWFGTLAIGARAFSRRLARPMTWTIIDALTGLVMIGIAVKLATGLP